MFFHFFGRLLRSSIFFPFFFVFRVPISCVFPGFSPKAQEQSGQIRQDQHLRGRLGRYHFRKDQSQEGYVLTTSGYIRMVLMVLDIYEMELGRSQRFFCNFQCISTEPHINFGLWSHFPWSWHEENSMTAENAPSFHWAALTRLISLKGSKAEMVRWKNGFSTDDHKISALDPTELETLLLACDKKTPHDAQGVACCDANTPPNIYIDCGCHPALVCSTLQSWQE